MGPMPIPGRDVMAGRFIPTLNQPPRPAPPEPKKKQDWTPPKTPLLMRLLEAATARAEKLEQGTPIENRLTALELLYREALAADREGRDPKIPAALLLQVLAFQPIQAGRPPALPAPHRPAEYAFPTYLALVNQINCTAYAMRFASVEKAETTLDLGVAPPDPWVAIDLTTESQVCDAKCLVRPYLRLHADASKDAIEQAAGMTLDLEVDGERLIAGGWAAEHLALPDGTGFRRTPFQFPNRTGGCLFQAAGLDKEQQADPSDSHGFMLPTASRIFLRVHGIHGTGTVLDGRLSAGLVLANYTTKP